ncbi:LssY C-terminal domain-containing protein [Arthrobacter sp. B10-11]|uniref:LssY C-terminal domain-containing protein n=1 Tax=Arthrobacter sp. B10-11 TaxID=3081160 RepID=UPI002952DD10|nr:LssY C-terminal domain-containing protein [Arthrobacter sp. B10-11]MDV8149109.1 LssY C-terminal domain-containing protein [Arthrobacter sp. B10-11]
MTRPAVRVPVAGVAREALDTVWDRIFFLIGGVAAAWLTYLLLELSFQWGWGQLWFTFVFWAMLAYLVLPRLHSILTRVYVPDYFIGRARTSDGLLGDPVNVALLGSEAQLHHVMRRAGWTIADDVTLASSWRIITSTVLRRSYLEAPVSPLFLFGRQQDFAYQQEVDGNPGKRHHVRFWRCPPGWLLPGGVSADWLAAGTYDRSVGFSLFTLQVTHKIDEHTDDERDHIVRSMSDAEPSAAVRVIRDFSTGYHTRNGGGDEIATDGDLPIVDLRATPVSGVAVARLPSDSRNRRPAPTIIGAALVAGRALAAAALAVSILLFPAEHLSADQSQLVLYLGLAVVVLFALAELLLAWFVFLGRNWARTLTMAVSAAAIGLQVIDVVNGGPGITLQTNLPGLTLDILLILALSSERSRVYARRDRKEPKRIAARPGGRAAI